MTEFGLSEECPALIEIEALLVGGEAMEGDEFVDADVGAESVLEGFSGDDMKSGIVVRNCFAVENVVHGGDIELDFFVTHDVFGEFANLVVAGEFVFADFDTEVPFEVFADDAIGKFVEPGVKLRELVRGE